MVNIANEQNLIPLNKRSKEEVKRIQSMGIKKSAETRAMRKTLRQDLKAVLDMKDNNGTTLQENMTKALIKQALKGNVRAYEVARDTVGEEKEQKEHYNISIPAKLIAKSFVDINRDIDNRKYLEYWFLGGRGSTKSTYWGHKVIELLNNNPNMCALFIRKVSNTLKDSVFSQMKYSDEVFKEEYPFIDNKWKFIKNPMEAINENGQVMYFRGADDPTKIKSIRPPKDKYIGLVIYEEFDQMAGMSEIRTINQSVIRGGEDFVQFYCCNTPKSKMHFVNKEALIPKDNRIIHHSDYRSVPKEWLGQTFIDEAEYLKKINPKAYEHEYLGKAVGIGGTVFENLEIREITDSEINTFDYIYQGIDWGYYPDPFDFGKMYYDSSKRELYLFFEYRANKKGNQEIDNILKEMNVDILDVTTADSAEPKSIGDFKSYGWNIHGAIKGAGSVNEGIKWLQSLNKIIIDPVRCPNTAKEFTLYEYLKDKDGNDISGYPDADNHSIDRTRYAMERIWKKKGQ